MRPRPPLVPRLRSPLRRVPPLALLLALLLSAAVACGDDSPVGTDPSIAGDWSGSAAFGAVQFSATFEQDGSAVVGSGDFATPLGSGPFVATGTVIGTAVDLTLVSAEFGTSRYLGTFVSRDRIEGHLDADAYSDLELALVRD